MRVATVPDRLTDTLSGLALFADLSPAELESVAHIIDDRRFADGERILRQGLSGSGFYLILSGEATIRLDGKEYGTLGRGEFFGEVTALLGGSPVADVVATHDLHCAIIPSHALEAFLLAHPKVMLRILQGEARKVRTATRWRS